MVLHVPETRKKAKMKKKEEKGEKEHNCEKHAFPQ